VLDAVLDEHGPEIEIHPVSRWGLSHQSLTLGALIARGLAGGVIILGIRVSDGAKAPRLRLNLPRGQTLPVTDSEELVVLVDRRLEGPRTSDPLPPARVPSYL